MISKMPAPQEIFGYFFNLEVSKGTPKDKLSRLVLKIVVMARQKARGKRQE
jgi:hypothetical protein